MKKIRNDQQKLKFLYGKYRLSVTLVFFSVSSFCIFRGLQKECLAKIGAKQNKIALHTHFEEEKRKGGSANRLLKRKENL